MFDNSCIVCVGSDFEEVNAKVVRCRGCGLGITLDPCVDSVEEDFYDRKYFTDNDTSGTSFFSDLQMEFDNGRFNEELDVIESIADKGSVLDIGCATGNFLMCAKLRGWDVFGFDISRFAADVASKRLGTEIASGRLVSGATFKRPFDLVTLHHVIEHVENPRAFLSGEVLPLVRKGGLLCIEVPNFDSLEAKVLGLDWEDLRPDQHRYHFTPGSLGLLVEKRGAKVVHAYTTSYPLWRIRLLTDYLLLLASLKLSIPYGGMVGRNTMADGVALDDEEEQEHRGIAHAALSSATRLLGSPVIRGINKAGMGKRLVLIASKE